MNHNDLVSCMGTGTTRLVPESKSILPSLTSLPSVGNSDLEIEQKATKLTKEERREISGVASQAHKIGLVQPTNRVTR